MWILCQRNYNRLYQNHLWEKKSNLITKEANINILIDEATAVQGSWGFVQVTKLASNEPGIPM